MRAMVIYPYKSLVLEHGFTWPEESSHVLNKEWYHNLVEIQCIMQLHMKIINYVGVWNEWTLTQGTNQRTIAEAKFQK